ncbi:hypothetical protein EST38_g12010 [Candolleomyces aberdarensis]|uniref:Uncharacterized protein n=1 Tax=Candolleomyces aberdarensis TaxID=2316362 RepID=A0A4Q2D634_9AGAR|nr:hypothetical protein EST38_g12010 [Candolleomyces aberdarensis]
MPPYRVVLNPNGAAEESDKENSPLRYGTSRPTNGGGLKRPASDPLDWPGRRKAVKSDPLVHHGRHFGRTVYAFANIRSLLQIGIEASSDNPPVTLEERRIYHVFWKLTRMVPGLDTTVLNADEDELNQIASLKGANSARSDDTRSVKGPVLDWITPEDNSPLTPPLSRNSKYDRGYNHSRTGYLLCPVNLNWSDPATKNALRNKELIPTGDTWPLFLYKDEKFDPSDPWAGLLRNRILVLGFKHIFTSPSSTDDTPRATRSGNAIIHGMTKVTRASIAYVATQIRFALSSASVFTRSDRDTDSETFYRSILELLDDPKEDAEVKELLSWWNKRIFPASSAVRRVAPENSALALIRARRAAFEKAMSSEEPSDQDQDDADEGEEGAVRFGNDDDDGDGYDEEGAYDYCGDEDPQASVPPEDRSVPGSSLKTLKPSRKVSGGDKEAGKVKNSGIGKDSKGKGRAQPDVPKGSSSKGSKNLSFKLPPVRTLRSRHPNGAFGLIPPVEDTN